MGPLRRLRPEVVSAASVDASSRVLDVATGTGEQALAFAEVAREVVGIDLSKAMLEVARRKCRFANIRFMLGDATALPFEDEVFDVSCISFALHEMPPSVRSAVLREMSRVTRRGGRMVIVDYALPRGRLGHFLAFHAIKLYERDHYAEFVRSNLQATLTETGLSLLDEHRALFGLARIIVVAPGHGHVRRTAIAGDDTCAPP